MRPIVTPVRSFVFDADDTEKESSFPYVGELWSARVTVPDFTNAITASLILKDPNAVEITLASTLAKNATHDITLARLTTGCGEKIMVRLSGAAGGTGGSVAVTFSMIDYLQN